MFIWHIGNSLTRMCHVSARSSALTEWRCFEVTVCHDNSHYVVKENCCFIVYGYHPWCKDEMDLQRFDLVTDTQWAVSSGWTLTINEHLCCACNSRIAVALLLLRDSQNFLQKMCHVKTISRKYWRIMWKNVFPHMCRNAFSDDWAWIAVPVFRGILAL